MKKQFPFYLLLLISAVVDIPKAMAQENYATLMNRVDNEYDNGDFASALNDAHTAVTINANDFRAHYYLGLIYLKLEHAQEALNEANTALPLATADAKPSVQKLADLATSMKKAIELRDQAASDESNGLRAKAAQEYETAYNNYPRWSSLGTSATDLYFALHDYPNAAVVMRKLAAGDNPQAAQHASKWLSDQANALSGLSENYIEAAGRLVGDDRLWQATPDELDEAVRDYTNAAKAAPDCTSQFSVCPWLRLARVLAYQMKTPDAENLLKEGGNWGLQIDKRTFHYKFQAAHVDGHSEVQGPPDRAWHAQVCDASFVQFLNDAFGGDAGRAASETCKELSANGIASSSQ